MGFFTDTNAFAKIPQLQWLPLVHHPFAEACSSFLEGFSASFNSLEADSILDQTCFRGLYMTPSYEYTHGFVHPVHAQASA